MNLKSFKDHFNEACWDGYKQVGMKKKGKRMVPNCVPESSKTNERKLTKVELKDRERRQGRDVRRSHQHGKEKI